jgi:hypothetical protein
MLWIVGVLVISGHCTVDDIEKEDLHVYIFIDIFITFSFKLVYKIFIGLLFAIRVP